jgi:hypothetical protein
MALQDCINKMKGLVTRDDRIRLQEFIDAGLTDDQAVRKLLLESDARVLDITAKAAEAGAAVQNRPDFIGEIRSLQKKRAEKVRAQRKKYAKEEQELNDQYSDSSTVIDFVKVYWNKLPENQRDGIVNAGIDLYDDQDLNKVLSAMLFDKNTRGNMQKGVMGLKGDTPVALVNSFKELRDGQAAVRERLAELAVLDAQAIEQLEEFGGRWDTFFQGRAPSEELKKFMRGSKAVDKDGNPQVVYHGTQGQEPFEIFDPDKGQSWGGWNAVGTWFSSEPIHAERYAEIPGGESGQMFPAYVSIKNPFEATWEEVTGVRRHKTFSSRSNRIKSSQLPATAARSILATRTSYTKVWTYQTSASALACYRRSGSCRRRRARQPR